MSDNVDTRITPALHPDNVKQIEGYDDEAAVVLAPTMTAFSEAYVAIQSVHDARAVAEKNPAWTDEQRLMQLDGFANKKLAQVTRLFDTTRSNLVKGIAYLEGELGSPA